MADQYGPTPDPLVALMRSVPRLGMDQMGGVNFPAIAKALRANPDVVLRALGGEQIAYANAPSIGHEWSKWKFPFISKRMEVN